LTVTSRLSELAGCTATTEEFFPIGLAGNQPRSSAGPGTAVNGIARHDRDSWLGLQLACLLQQVQNTTRHAKRLVLRRSQEDLTARMRQNSWSVTECLEHIALTTRVFLPPIAEIMAKTPRLTRNRPLRCDMLAKVLIRTLEPPYRLRHKVLPHLAPQRNDFPSAWKTFLESQDQLAEITRSAVGLAIDTVKIQSPVCSRVSYSIYGALGVLSAHQRRHLWQMEQTLRSLDRRMA
jgi:hypothetical protein